MKWSALVFASLIFAQNLFASAQFNFKADNSIQTIVTQSDSDTQSLALVDEPNFTGKWIGAATNKSNGATFPVKVWISKFPALYTSGAGELYAVATEAPDGKTRLSSGTIGKIKSYVRFDFGGFGFIADLNVDSKAIKGESIPEQGQFAIELVKEDTTNPFNFTEGRMTSSLRPIQDADGQWQFNSPQSASEKVYIGRFKQESTPLIGWAIKNLSGRFTRTISSVAALPPPDAKVFCAPMAAYTNFLNDEIFRYAQSCFNNLGVLTVLSELPVVWSYADNETGYYLTISEGSL